MVVISMPVTMNVRILGKLTPNQKPSPKQLKKASINSITAAIFSFFKLIFLLVYLLTGVSMHRQLLLGLVQVLYQFISATSKIITSVNVLLVFIKLVSISWV